MFFSGKFILPFLVLVHMGLGDDPHEATRIKCREETGLTEDETSEGFTNVLPKFGCYIKCFLFDMEIVDGNGIVAPEKMTIEIGQDLRDESEPTIYACFEETKDIEDGCEKMVDFWKCFQKKIPETYAKLGIFGKPLVNRNYGLS